MRPALRSLLLIVVCGGAQSALAQDQTFLYFNSRPGDPIGHGKQFTRTPADGTFFVSRIDAGVEIRFIGATFWYLDFVPPVAANLTPGHYEGSMGYPFQSPLTPGLNVSGDGLGCNTLTGRFVVRDVAVVGGTVTRGYSISRADVAQLMLAVLDDPATINQPVGLAY